MPLHDDGEGIVTSGVGENRENDTTALSTVQIVHVCGVRCVVCGVWCAVCGVRGRGRRACRARARSVY